MNTSEARDALITSNKEAKGCLETLEKLFKLHLKLGSSSSDHATKEHIATMKEIIKTNERTIAYIGLTLEL